MFSPIGQFEQFKLTFAKYEFFFTNFFSIITNFSVSMFLVGLLVFLMITRQNYKDWTIYSIISLELWRLVVNLVKTNLDIKRHIYITNYYYLFLVILLSNIVGLIPYCFTTTSWWTTTIYLALSYYIALNIIGINLYKWETSNVFLPAGIPLLLVPLLILLEVISYVAKVFSLSIRLFANLFSGHALLKILTSFIYLVCRSKNPLMSYLAGVIWVLISAIMSLESLLAFIQAYVFTLLAVIYKNDIIIGH